MIKAYCFSEAVYKNKPKKSILETIKVLQFLSFGFYHFFFHEWEGGISRDFPIKNRDISLDNIFSIGRGKKAFFGDKKKCITNS